MGKEKRIFEKGNQIILGEKITSKRMLKIIKMIRKENTKNKIPTILLSSCGGYAAAVLSFYEIVKKQKLLFRVEVTDDLHSATIIILLSAPKEQRFCTTISLMLIHKIRGGIYGTSKEISQFLKEMEFFQKQYVEIIQKETNLKKKEIEELIDLEQTHDYKFIIKHGFAKLI